MSFLSKILDLVFPAMSDADSDSGSSLGSTAGGIDDNFIEHQFTEINPANGMLMVGGIGGVDITGNLWGQSDTFSDHGHLSSVDCSADAFDTSSMFDNDSMFDSDSMFD